MIKNYVFDCGKVLVQYEPKELTAACVQGPMAEHICEVVFDRLYWDRLDDGTMTEADIKEAMRSRLSAEEYPFACAVLDGWIKNLTPVPAMLDLVKDIKKKGGKIYLLSNISKTFAATWQENAYLKELFQYFDGLVCSGPLGITKPHREIFDHLLNTYNLKAEECIFIDDAPINIEGAAQCGIPGYIFDGDAQKLRKSLKIE